MRNSPLMGVVPSARSEIGERGEGLAGVSKPQAVSSATVCLTLLMLYFAVRMICYATWFHPYVPPDEVDLFARARFFAEVLGLTVTPGRGYFAQVRVNENLTFDFADEDGPIASQHYAFHVSDPEFDAILARVKVRGLDYGSEPHDARNGRLNRRRGGRGFYFEDPNGHLLEVMTVPETGS